MSSKFTLQWLMYIVDPAYNFLLSFGQQCIIIKIEIK